MKSLLVLATLIAVSYGHSPVLLWPADEFAVPEGQSVLDMMNIDDFQKLFDGKKIIVFHKRTFNLEEVSYPKKQLSYLQSVDAIALQGVKSIHRFVGGLTSSGNLKFVRLDDGDLVEQQDQIKNAMESNPGFAAILLGSGSHRSRRDAADNNNDTPVCKVRQGPCWAYVGAIEADDKTSTCIAECGADNKSITITVADVKLNVKGDANGYTLTTEGSYKLDTDTVWFPTGFSYSCGALKLSMKSSDGKVKKMTLRQLQVSLDVKDAKDGFPEAYDCATWFTSALWMGTVVALFYIFILFVAVLYLLDVKTNDRFDDPKGKTITVNVAE